jgi:hypothetical protein
MWSVTKRAVTNARSAFFELDFQGGHRTRRARYLFACDQLRLIVLDAHEADEFRFCRHGMQSESKEHGRRQSDFLEQGFFSNRVCAISDFWDSVLARRKANQRVLRLTNRTRGIPSREWGRRNWPHSNRRAAPPAHCRCGQVGLLGFRLLLAVRKKIDAVQTLRVLLGTLYIVRKSFRTPTPSVPPSSKRTSRLQEQLAKGRTCWLGSPSSGKLTNLMQKGEMDLLNSMVPSAGVNRLTQIA